MDVSQRHAARTRATHASYVSSGAAAWADKLRRRGDASAAWAHPDAGGRARAQKGRRDLANDLVLALESVRVRAHAVPAMQREGVSLRRMLLAGTAADDALHAPSDRRSGGGGAAAERDVSPQAHFSAAVQRLLVPGVVGDEHTEGAVEGTLAHSARGFRRALAELHATVAEHATRARRRSLAILTNGASNSNNVFVSPAHAACRDYVCPTGVCLADKRRCPTPTVWTPGVAVDYGILQASLAASELDERVIVQGIFSCWNGYAANPRSNPFNIANFGHDVLRDTSLTWCVPMLTPFAYKFPKIDNDLRQQMLDACGPTGCACDGYFEGTYDATNFWFRSMPFLVLARIHDGLLSAQWTVATLITVPLGVGAVWEQIWMPWSPPVARWFAQLWSVQGQSGSTQTQLMCSVLHYPSVFYIVALAVITLCLFFGYRVCVLYTCMKLVSLVFLPTEILLAWTLDTLENDSGRVTRLGDEAARRVRSARADLERRRDRLFAMRRAKNRAHDAVVRLVADAALSEEHAAVRREEAAAAAAAPPPAAAAGKWSVKGGDSVV